MYRFLFTVKFNKAIDLFYEYVISRCRRYFDVPNNDIVFRVNYNKKEESLLIVVFSDETKDFLDNLSDEEFSFTKNECKYITFDTISQREISVVGSELCLPTNEVRYIKFSRDVLDSEMCKMFCDMSNQYLRIDKHDAKFSYDFANQEYKYEGSIPKYNKHWKKRKNTCIDISNEMSRFYI